METSRRSLVFGGVAGLGMMAGAASLPFLFSGPREEKPTSGSVLLPEPIQADPPDTVVPFEVEGWRVTPVAGYSIDAHVLLRERYRWDDLAPIVPLDLALSWGAASDPEVIGQMDMFQSGRFLHWRIPLDTGLDPGEISRSSSNVHVIPGTPELREILLDFEAGDRVHLEGVLVDLEDQEGRVWRSSRTRTDVGAGACEILFVQVARFL